MPLQSTLAGTEKGLCLLSFDAGGARGISQLKILVDLMQRQSFDVGDGESIMPCSIFDMITGTGTGGFIAILLVIFGLTAEEALDEFIGLCSSVLDKTGMSAAIRTAALRDYISSLSSKYNLPPDTRLLDPNMRSNGCKLIIPVSYSAHASATSNIRNFDARGDQALNLTVADAIVATLARPPLFDPISVHRNGSTFEYVGGDLILGNPIRELITEAYKAFGEGRSVACLLSIGCGHPVVVATPSDSDMASWNELLERLMTDNEEKSGEIKSQMGQLGLYHRFSVGHGLEGAVQNGILESGAIVSHTSIYLGEFTVSQSIDLCVTALKTHDGVISLGQLRHSGGEVIAAATIPPVTKIFVKRKQPWEFMEKVIFPKEEEEEEEEEEPTMLAITGIGGCGKTQIVLKFMREYKSKFISQLYIDGSSEDRIRADIVRHVRSLGTEHSQKTFDDCLIFLERPSQTGRRIFLYDNVDDPSIELAPLIPQTSSCVIIITSRNRSIALLCPEAHLELDVMSMDEAVELLLYNNGRSLSASPQAVEDVKAIANELGCLPVALTHARTFIYETQCTTREYLERLSSIRAKVLAAPIKNQQNIRYIPAFAAFEASYEKLTPSTQQLLRFLSCFHWANFPLDLVASAAKENFTGYERCYVEHEDEFHSGKRLLEDIFLIDGCWDIAEMDGMLHLLQNYSLSTLIPGIETKLLHMHPLLHEWMYSQIPDDQLPQYQSAAVMLLAFGAHDEHTPSEQYLVGHVAHLSPLWRQLNPNEAEAFGLILQSAGGLEDARYFREKVVKQLQEENKLDIKALSCAKSLLASIYRDLGKVSEAEEIQQMVLRLLRETQGDNHLDTVTACSDLALTYCEQGYFDKAEALQEEVLQRRKELQGDLHTETIDAYANLALTYRDRNRLDKAKALQLEVLAIRKKTLGERHHDTVNARSALAITLHDLGSYVEAEAIQVDVLKIRKETLGDRHPLTINESTNLGITYCALERLEEAEEIQERVWALRKEIFGERHPDTLMAANDLAYAYCHRGKLQGAKEIQENVFKLGKVTWGEEHHNTAAIMLTLAEIYEALGKKVEASNIIHAAIPIIRGTMGEDHPYYEFAQALATRVRVVEDSSYSTEPSEPVQDYPAPQPILVGGFMSRLWRLSGSSQSPMP